MLTSPQLYGHRGDLTDRSSLWINWIYTDRAVHAPSRQAHSVWMECQTTDRTDPWPHETFVIFYRVKSWPLHIVDSYILVHWATEKSRSTDIILIFFYFWVLQPVAPVTMTSLWVCRQLQQFLFPYSPFHITTCFSLYRPSSGEIYTVVF
jgi:hypothetical protein